MKSKAQTIFYITYSQTWRREVNTGRITRTEGTVVYYYDKRLEQEVAVNTTSPHVRELSIK